MQNEILFFFKPSRKITKKKLLSQCLDWMNMTNQTPEIWHKNVMGLCIMYEMWTREIFLRSPVSSGKGWVVGVRGVGEGLGGGLRWVTVGMETQRLLSADLKGGENNQIDYTIDLNDRWVQIVIWVILWYKGYSLFYIYTKHFRESCVGERQQCPNLRPASFIYMGSKTAAEAGRAPHGTTLPL